MKRTFEFESVGKAHNEEVNFFKFLVTYEFNITGSKVIQWCTFNGLTITIEALSEEVIEWGFETIKGGFETPTGYKYILK